MNSRSVERRRTALSVLLAVLAFSSALRPQQRVADTVHNLSASGPSARRAAASQQICDFCHITHSADTSAPLWNRALSSATYIPYASSTAVAQPGQPTGNSPDD